MLTFPGPARQGDHEVDDLGRTISRMGSTPEAELAIQVIRSLKSDFLVLRRDDASLVMHLDSAEVAGERGAWLIEFETPSHEWASEWDAVANDWRSRSDLARPVDGRITEAFIKRGGGGYLLSFSDGTDPIVRWGFSAASVAVRRAT